MPYLCLYTAEGYKAHQIYHRLYPNTPSHSRCFRMWIQSLCNQIPYDKCLQFDKALHFKYTKDTKHTVTEPVHTTFLLRDYHGIYITSILRTHLQGQARELNVRLAPFQLSALSILARLVAMATQHNRHKNILRDTIIRLAQYGLHFKDAYQPVVATPLQLLLHEWPRHTLMGQSTSHPYTDSTNHFTIIENSNEHTSYAHN